MVILAGGASIFWHPADETVYDASGPIRSCLREHGCIGVYRLEIGNTGRRLQPDVRVRLHAAVLDTAIMRPKVRDYGKFDRPARVTRDGPVVVYALGSVEPDERVELSFVLQRPTIEALPAWPETLVSVEPEHGAALPGSPGFIVLLRMWYAIARVF